MPDASQSYLDTNFPLLQLNPIAQRERNAFKPVYQIHKWWARRAASIFRALLVAVDMPAHATASSRADSGARRFDDEEFMLRSYYPSGRTEGDGRNRVILDPFMGGGTTVIEALRLGYRVVGVDYSPVAWFVVKTEAEPADLGKLRHAFEQLASRPVQQESGPPVALRTELLSLYRTKDPFIPEAEADIIYAFWVKQARCIRDACGNAREGAGVLLFKDHRVAKKTPKIRYTEVTCPNCARAFDWDLEWALLAAVEGADGPSAAGLKRGKDTRWARTNLNGVVACPFCREDAFREEGGTRARPVKRQATLGDWDVRSAELSQPKAKKGKIGQRAKRGPSTGDASDQESVSLEIKSKKVDLWVLHCALCGEVFQVRGLIPPKKAAKPERLVPCPTCRRRFDPYATPIQPKRKEGQTAFICDLANEDATCGTPSGIVESLKKHGERPAEFVGYALLASSSAAAELKDPRLAVNNYKFFKRWDSDDQARFESARARWSKAKDGLLWPRGVIEDGKKTGDLLTHFYTRWFQLFGERQLYCLATLLHGILQETDRACQELLLSAFYSMLEQNNMLARWNPRLGREGHVDSIFSHHNFQPKVTTCENNVWGTADGRGTFWRMFEKMFEGKQFAVEPWDRMFAYQDPIELGALPGFERLENESHLPVRSKPQLIRSSGEDEGEAKPYASYPRDGLVGPTFDPVGPAEVDAVLRGASALALAAQSSTDLRTTRRQGKSLRFLPDRSIDYVVTDPPYAGAVNYAELADFFYVWLRAALESRYPDEFAPALTPKSLECVENPFLSVTSEDFRDRLTKVFSECYRVLTDQPHSALVFTFHQAKKENLVHVLEALFRAGFDPATNEGGFYIEATYPVPGEAANSFAIMSQTRAITYDVIFVCRKRRRVEKSISWTELKTEIKSEVRQMIALLADPERGEPGQAASARKRLLAVSGQRLLPEDIRYILRGTCLKHYSRHYNLVFGPEVSGKETPVTPAAALDDIDDLLTELEDEYDPLSASLASADAVTRAYLRHLTGRTEVRVDKLNKLFKGVVTEQHFLNAKLLSYGRKGARASYEVVPPEDRFELLARTADRNDGSLLLIDKVHYILELTRRGAQVHPVLDRWRDEQDSILGALEAIYKHDRDKETMELCLRIISWIEPAYRDRYKEQIQQYLAFAVSRKKASDKGADEEDGSAGEAEEQEDSDEAAGEREE